jgi:hypothetical protein
MTRPQPVLAIVCIVPSLLQLGLVVFNINTDRLQITGAGIYLSLAASAILIVVNEQALRFKGTS